MGARPGGLGLQRSAGRLVGSRLARPDGWPHQAARTSCQSCRTHPARTRLPPPAQGETRAAIEDLAARRIGGRTVILNAEDPEVAQYVAQPADAVM